MLKCIPSQSDHLGMMINGRVKYLSHRTSYWAAAAMWVAVTPSVIAARTPWKKQKKKTGEELSWVSSASYFSCDFFFFFFCVLLSSLLFEKPAAAQRKRFPGKPTHTKMQVQGREDERRTLWAYGTTREIVVCQWLLSQLIIELGKRSIVPVRWSHFQLAAYWDSNLWQY